MVRVNVSPSIAANSTDSDVFDGKRAAQLPSNGRIFEVTLLATAAATGVEHEVFVGLASNPLERSPVGFKAAAGATVYPDDLVVTFRARGGEKITVPVHNTTIGAIIYSATLIIKQVA